MTHLGDRISALVDGELDGAERGDAERHLGSCESCRLEVSLIEVTRGLVRGLSVLEPPPGLLPRSARRLRWVSSPGWIAAASLAGVLALALVVGPGEPGVAFEMGTLTDQHIARTVGDPGVATFRGSGP